jgi:hypothetical protein
MYQWRRSITCWDMACLYVKASAARRRYKTVPNCDLARPSQRSPIPNFYLAGARPPC